MFFILSKIFNAITFPINWLFVLVVLYFIVKPKELKKLIFVLLILIFIIFTNERMYVKAVYLWSAKYNIEFDTTQYYEIAIIVGGSVDYSPQWQQVNFNERADRMTESIRLYRLGKIKKLYLSGESAFSIRQDISYAPQFLQYMREMGVNREDIILEKQARTTAEHVLYLKELFKKEDVQPPILLITSGWHMRRTLKAFENSGLNLVPYAVDIPGQHPKITWLDFLPKWRAAQDWQELIHEMVGMLVI